MLLIIVGSFLFVSGMFIGIMSMKGQVDKYYQQVNDVEEEIKKLKENHIYPHQ